MPWLGQQRKGFQHHAGWHQHAESELSVLQVTRQQDGVTLHWPHVPGPCHVQRGANTMLQQTAACALDSCQRQMQDLTELAQDATLLKNTLTDADGQQAENH
jgi:hypothetical protein